MRKRMPLIAGRHLQGVSLQSGLHLCAIGVRRDFGISSILSANSTGLALTKIAFIPGGEAPSCQLCRKPRRGLAHFCAVCGAKMCLSPSPRRGPLQSRRDYFDAGTPHAITPGAGVMGDNCYPPIRAMSTSTYVNWFPTRRMPELMRDVQTSAQIIGCGNTPLRQPSP